MLRRAVDGGVNYVDTAYVYHEQQSETWLAQALRDGYRDKVRLATKMPVWLVKEPPDFDRLLDEQLRRLQTDSVDFYLLHSLDEKHWAQVRATDQLAAAERALADGRIGHLGFSFHGGYELFEQVLDATDLWEFCQIQLNYMDEDYQAGRRGLELAAARGLGVIVMEPLRGGMLARNLPPQVEAAWREAPVAAKPGRVGAAVGLEPARGVAGAERHERACSTWRRTWSSPAARARGCSDPRSSRRCRACATSTAS